MKRPITASDPRLPAHTKRQTNLPYLLFLPPHNITQLSLSSSIRLLLPIWAVCFCSSITQAPFLLRSAISLFRGSYILGTIGKTPPPNTTSLPVVSLRSSQAADTLTPTPPNSRVIRLSVRDYLCRCPAKKFDASLALCLSISCPLLTTHLHPRRRRSPPYQPVLSLTLASHSEQIPLFHGHPLNCSSSRIINTGHAPHHRATSGLP